MTIQRYKGLGEMNPEQLWETTLDPQKRTLLKVQIEDETLLDETFVRLMGEKVEPRRDFIHAHAKEVKSNVKYLNTTTEELLNDKSHLKFDLITCLEMLEHVPEPSQTINEFSSLLSQNGDLIISTINRNPRSYLFAVLGAEYILNLLPKGTHDYSKFIKPSEISKWIRSANLILNETIGLSYNPITDTYWLGKDIAVNYMMHIKKDNESN